MRTRSSFTGSRRFGAKPAWTYVGLAATIAMTVAACSSSTSPSASGSPTTGASSTAGAGGTAAHDQAVAAAAAVVQSATTRPTTLPIVDLPAKPTPGGTIDVIACAVPSCQTFAQIVQDAVKDVGWKVKFVSAGASTKDAVAAYDQAVRDKPNGVIGTGGYDPRLFAKQLSQLAELKIPVFMQYASVDSPMKGLTGIVYGSGNTRANGVLLGNAILADSKGQNANVLYVGTPEVANNYKNTRAGAKSVLEASGACQGCSSDQLDMTLAQIGTALPGLLVSHLRANPKINYVVGDFGDIVDGFPQALKQAGLDTKVKVLANGVGSIQAQYLKSSTMFAASYNPNLEILWTDAGAVLASAQGVDLKLDAHGEYPSLPGMLITPQNVVLPPENGYWPMVEDYQSQFHKAWKVS